MAQKRPSPMAALLRSLPLGVHQVGIDDEVGGEAAEAAAAEEPVDTDRPTRAVALLARRSSAPPRV
uniref:Uncharacterized protein n=1 Tax=Oryza barthii TaxID=65489 RepID=A0A0D3H2C1_9ORYZ